MRIYKYIKILSSTRLYYIYFLRAWVNTLKTFAFTVNNPKSAAIKH